MAKFLNTSGTTYHLEEMIKKASDRLILISPYLKLNERVKELKRKISGDLVPDVVDNEGNIVDEQAKNQQKIKVGNKTIIINKK